MTASERRIAEAVMGLFDATISRTAPIRRVNIALMGVVPARMATPTLFDNIEADEHEESLAQTAVAVLRAERASARDEPEARGERARAQLAGGWPPCVRTRSRKPWQTCRT